jgi:hypothetical protein
MFLPFLSATLAFADPCKGLGVGRDAGSSVAISTVVRPSVGEPTSITLQLRGSDAHMVLRPEDAGPPPTGEEATLELDGVAPQRWTLASREQARTAPAGTYVFVLHEAELGLLADHDLTSITMPIGSGGVLEILPDKDNQKTLRAGARCVASRLAEVDAASPVD